MPAIPSVNITVQDNGASAALSVPAQNVQLKIGCAVGGTPNQVYATSSPTDLRSHFIGGQLVEAGGLVCLSGNICVAISVPINTAGTATAVTHTGTGTSVVTTTLDGTNGAWDTYYVLVNVVTGGTIGVNGIVLQISLDAGRTFGNPLSIGTANTLVIGAPFSPPTVGGTGVQLNFGAGTMVAGDTFKFSTYAPQWSGGAVATALAAFQASQYGVAGVGSIHIVGDAMHGGSSTTDIVTISDQVQAGVGDYEYQRAIVELRDALTPVAWGGSGETEATWMAALELAASGLTAEPRICADGGYYNMPSAYSIGGANPSYRRSLAYAQATRRTQIALNRRAGAVADGPLANIAVNPATDPTDGFVYHDERVTPGLNAARIASALTWPKKGAGFFMCQEPLLSAPGSQFTELVIGNVVDVACDIGYAAGVEVVSDNLLVQSNGTLDPIALNILQGSINTALSEGMTQNGLVSSVTATVSATANVLATGIIPIAISVTPDAYVNSITETISLSNGG